MSDLNLVYEILRDVNGSNEQRNLDRNENFLSWKNWRANDIFDCYENCSKTVKSIIRRAIKTDGASLDNDIEKLEKAEKK